MSTAARGIHRRSEIVLSDSLVERFWKRVDCSASGGCWPWLGAMRNGYGAIKHQGKVVSAHVVSFVIHGGALPSGVIVTHTCDNRACVNPTHLAAGSFASNVIEMHERRKVSSPRGVECYNAVLNEDLVREIRRVARENCWGEVRTARHFGLGRWTVKNVLSGNTWKHVV